ncbi:MAG: STAS domain-containing protein [Deltaproteobacteria bacterium]|nr:STAS domain-containing protein [Deltaproteobacteria bacterium]MBF0509015.1 STAS domain-containing protein [Deltaproteobacteria bacterium]MBF0525494.1 STAS domain-containing protein [Deltaproteobacteria bacterium]
MELSIKEQGDVQVVLLGGRFDAQAAGMVEEKLNGVLDAGHKKLLVDLGGTNYISSAGLRVLLATTKKIKKVNGRIVLSSLTQYVKEVFEIAGFTSIFDIYGDLDEALKHF